MSLAERIENKLRAALAPVHLVVENESGMHNVPKGSETHFKVLVVSPAFDGLGRVERHRKVNAVLADEFARGLHALSLRALTEGEAASQGEFVSPKCLGGSKADAS
ncbi:MAG TPA: BolA family protein [Minicystis sp.]|nr:BolA family protein [Minicystis sp.]